jgi:hypothetical protein
MHSRVWLVAVVFSSALIACAAGLWSGSGNAAMRSGTLPQGFGISARYPGDVGIARDPSVLFAEDFEEGDLGDVIKRWDQASNEDGEVLALSGDVSPAGAGRHSMQMTATLGENTGGHLYTRLPRGVDQVYARFYVKFPKEAQYIHHFVHLGGYNPATPYPQGGAGERPRGDERVTAGIEPAGEYGAYPPPGVWNFYCYWPEMKISADEKYWGNGLRPAEDVIAPRDTWQCVEVMMKLNSTPDAHDGELALWVDGELKGHFVKGARRGAWSGMGFQLTDTDGTPFEGFRWRTSSDLKINFFWLLHYVTEGPYGMNKVESPDPINRVWFDDIVVATKYIGPIRKP